MRDHGGTGEHHMMGFTTYTGFWLVIAAMLLVVIFIVMYLLKKNNNQNVNERELTNCNALTILDKRYAKGELTEAEYNHKKEVLQKK